MRGVAVKSCASSILGAEHLRYVLAQVVVEDAQLAAVERHRGHQLVPDARQPESRCGMVQVDPVAEVERTMRAVARGRVAAHRRVAAIGPGQVDASGGVDRHGLEAVAAELRPDVTRSNERRPETRSGLPNVAPTLIDFTIITALSCDVY